MESGLDQFLQQIPAGLIGMFCLSAIALIGVMAYIVWVRTNRTKATANGMPLVGFALPTTPTPLDASGFGDMPDLDILTTPPPMPEVAPRPSGMQRVTLSEGDQIDAVEVLTILRDVADGGLLVQIGDKVYRNPPAAADTEFKRRFNLTMKELATGKRVTVETPPVEASPGVSTATAEAPAAPLPPLNVPPPAPPVISPGMPLPGDLPKFKMPDKPEIPQRGRGRKAPVHEPIPEINIAAAIESFLQHKLALTPAFAGRNIHVRPAAHGGVEIDVEGRVFEAVGDIENAEVRAFLTATIEEWQSRQ